MQNLRKLLGGIPLPLLLMASLTLGLAPFVPEPHVWEKLKMLLAGEMAKPVDIFDFLLHGTPWVVLLLKLTLGRRAAS